METSLFCTLSFPETSFWNTVKLGEELLILVQRIKLKVFLTRRGNIYYIHAEYNDNDKFLFVFTSRCSEAEEEITLCHQIEDRRLKLFLWFSLDLLYFLVNFLNHSGKQLSMNLSTLHAWSAVSCDYSMNWNLVY